jgi:predicted nucleotidyltransferase component of viral defense system
MNEIITARLKKYQCTTIGDYENALKEIIQEIALLGMWRAKFFEIGAFYGGSSLRILHGLNRFSEDLDFSLLKSNKKFDISRYENSLTEELKAYDFEVTIEKKIKNIQTNIESAFIKSNTLIHLIKVNPHLKTHKNQILKIKIEVDISPPIGADTEVISHFFPIAFSIKTFTLPTLFAGKLAATLFRPYQFNTKGRDWYDFLWYISREIPLNIKYLKEIMIQQKLWTKNKELKLDDVRKIFNKKLEELNLNQAQSDVLPFIKDQFQVKSWNKKLFNDAFEKIKIL